MRIPIYFGFYNIGRLERPVGYVATRFFCIQGLPIFPVGGVSAHPDASGQLVLSPAPISLASVAAAYFRVWGFLAACGAGALVAVFMTTPSNSMFIALPAAAAAMVLLNVVTLSWVVLGVRNWKPRARPLLLAVGIPAMLLFAVYGWAWVKRAERCHYKAYRSICGIEEPDLSMYDGSHRPGASATNQPSVSTAPSVSDAQKAAVMARKKLLSNLNDELRLVYGFDDAKTWPTQKCDAAAMKQAIAGKSPVVLHTSYAYGMALDKAFRREPPEPVTAQAWLTSASLQTLARGSEDALIATMNEISTHPYMVLIDITAATDASSSLSKGKKTWTAGEIAARIAVFETTRGALACASDAIRATYTPHDARDDGNAGLSAAFKIEVFRALKRAAPDLQIEFDAN